MDERMACLWSVNKFAKWKYETDEPTKANVNVVTRQCRDGVLPAVKVGGSWRIDVSQIVKEVGK